MCKTKKIEMCLLVSVHIDITSVDTVVIDFIDSRCMFILCWVSPTEATVALQSCHNVYFLYSDGYWSSFSD